MRITKAKEDEKDLIMQYWKQSFPDAKGMSIDAYFDVYFNVGETKVLRNENLEILAIAQVKPKVLNLSDKKLRVDYITHVMTRPKFQGKGYMKILIEGILEASSKEHILTILKPFEPSVFRSLGFENVVSTVEYSITGNSIPNMGTEGIILSPNAKDLLEVYNNFTGHFDGYFDRDEGYYELLLSYVKACGGDIVAFSDGYKKIGYCVYIQHNTHVEIIECAYDMSGTLIKLLSFISRGKQRVLLTASTSEKIHRLFPDAKKTIQPFIMAKLHDKALFERLYDVKVLSSYSAFNISSKPKFNRDYQ